LSVLVIDFVLLQLAFNFWLRRISSAQYRKFGRLVPFLSLSSCPFATRRHAGVARVFRSLSCRFAPGLTDMTALRSFTFDVGGRAAPITLDWHAAFRLETYYVQWKGESLRRAEELNFFIGLKLAPPARHPEALRAPVF
jgi:hypothetical protein